MDLHRCFLCSTSHPQLLPVTNIVTASQRSIANSLQNLAKAKEVQAQLIFQIDSGICSDCYENLEAYEELKAQLIQSHHLLVEKLKHSLDFVLDDEFTKLEEQIIIEDKTPDDVYTNVEYEVKAESGVKHEIEAREDEYIVEEIDEFLDIAEDMEPEDTLDADENYEEEANNSEALDADDDYEDDEPMYDDDDDDDDANIKTPTSAGFEFNDSDDDDEEKCELCGQLFMSLYHLRRHSAEVHNTELVITSNNKRPHVCNVCGVPQKSEVDLELHMNVHEGKSIKQCRYCDKEFPRVQRTIRHMLTHRRDNEKVCNECGKVFAKKSDVRRHKLKAHKPNHVYCKVCGIHKRNTEHMELHMNTHEGKTEYQCRYCDKEFSRPRHTLRHMRTHWNIKKYQCEKCGERFAVDSALYTHRLIHEGQENPMSCTICKMNFKTKKTYSYHMRTHEQNRPRHHCTLCTKSFTERYTLKMHMKTHGVTDFPSTRTRKKKTDNLSKPQSHEADEAAKAITVIGSEEVFYLDSGEEFHDHEEEVESKSATTKMQTCVICDLEFPSKLELDSHLASEHDVVF